MISNGNPEVVLLNDDHLFTPLLTWVAGIVHLRCVDELVEKEFMRAPPPAAVSGSAGRVMSRIQKEEGKSGISSLGSDYLRRAHKCLLDNIIKPSNGLPPEQYCAKHQIVRNSFLLRYQKETLDNKRRRALECILLLGVGFSSILDLLLAMYCYIDAPSIPVKNETIKVLDNWSKGLGQQLQVPSLCCDVFPFLCFHLSVMVNSCDPMLECYHSDVLIMTCHSVKRLMANTSTPAFDDCLGTLIQFLRFLCFRITKVSWISPTYLPAVPSSRVDEVFCYMPSEPPLSMRESLCQVARVLDLAFPYIVSQLSYCPKGNAICLSLCEGQSLCFPFRVVEHSARSLALLSQLKGDTTRFCRPHLVVDQITKQKSLLRGVSQYLATARTGEAVPEIISLCLERLGDPDWSGSCLRILSSWLQAVGKEAAKTLGNPESNAKTDRDQNHPISHLAEVLILSIEYATHEMSDAHFSIIAHILGLHVKLLSPVLDLGKSRSSYPADNVGCSVKLQLASDTVCQLDSLLRLIFEDLASPVSVPIIDSRTTTTTNITSGDWEGTKDNVFIATRVIHVTGRSVLTVRLPELKSKRQLSGTVELLSTSGNTIHDKVVHRAVISETVRTVLIMLDVPTVVDVHSIPYKVVLTLPTMITGISVLLISLPVSISPATECLVLSAWISGFAVSSALTLSRCGLSECERRSMQTLQSSPLFRYGLVQSSCSTVRKASTIMSLLVPIEAIDEPMDMNPVCQLTLVSQNEEINTFLTDLALGQGAALKLDERLRPRHSPSASLESSAIRTTVAAALKHSPQRLVNLAITLSSDPTIEVVPELLEMWNTISRAITVTLIQHKQTWHLASYDDLASCIATRARLVLRCEYYAHEEHTPRPSLRRSSLFNMLPTCPATGVDNYDSCERPVGGSMLSRPSLEGQLTGLTDECLQFVIPHIPPPEQPLGLSDLTAPMAELPALVRQRIDAAKEQVHEIFTTLIQRDERALHCLAAFRFASRTAAYQPDLLDLDTVSLSFPKTNAKNQLSNTQIRKQRHSLWLFYRSIFISMLGILCKNALGRCTKVDNYHPLCFLEGVGKGDTYSLRASLATICKSILSGGITDEALSWISFDITPSDVDWISYTGLLSQLFLMIHATQITSRRQLATRCAYLIKRLSVRAAVILSNWSKWQITIRDSDECKEKLHSLLTESVVGLCGLISTSENSLNHEIAAVAFDTITQLEQFSELTGQLILTEVTTTLLVSAATHSNIHIPRKAVILSCRRLVSIIAKYRSTSSIPSLNRKQFRTDTDEALQLLNVIIPSLGAAQLLQYDVKADDATGRNDSSEGAFTGITELLSSPLEYTNTIVQILKDGLANPDFRKSSIVKNCFENLWKNAAQASTVLANARVCSKISEKLLTCLGALTLLSGSTLLPVPGDVIEVWKGNPDHVECCGGEYNLVNGTSPHTVGYWEAARVTALDYASGCVSTSVLSDDSLERSTSTPLSSIRPCEKDVILLAGIKYFETSHFELLIQVLDYSEIISSSLYMSLIANDIIYKTVMLSATAVRSSPVPLTIPPSTIEHIASTGSTPVEYKYFLTLQNSIFSQNSCSRVQSGCNKILQPRFTCVHCNIKGLCLYCAIKCHSKQGHSVVETDSRKSDVQEQKFHCQCTEIGCLALKEDIHASKPTAFDETGVTLMRGLPLLQIVQQIESNNSSPTNTKGNNIGHDNVGVGQKFADDETAYSKRPVPYLNLSTSELLYRMESDLLACAKRSTIVCDRIRQSVLYVPSPGDIALYTSAECNATPVVIKSLSGSNKAIVCIKRDYLLVFQYVLVSQLQPLRDLNGDPVVVSSVPNVVLASLQRRVKLSILRLFMSVATSVNSLTACTYLSLASSNKVSQNSKTCLLNVIHLLAPQVTFAACDPVVPPDLQYCIDQLPVSVAQEVLKLLKIDLSQHLLAPPTILPTHSDKIHCEGNSRVIVMAKPDFHTRATVVSFSNDPEGNDVLHTITAKDVQDSAECVFVVLPVAVKSSIYFKVRKRNAPSSNDDNPFWVLSLEDSSTLKYYRQALLASLLIEKISVVPLLVRSDEVSQNQFNDVVSEKELSKNGCRDNVEIAVQSSQEQSRKENVCVENREKEIISHLDPTQKSGSLVTVASLSLDNQNDSPTQLEMLEKIPAVENNNGVAVVTPECGSSDRVMTPSLSPNPSPLATFALPVSPPLRIERCRSGSLPSASSSPRLFAPCLPQNSFQNSPVGSFSNPEMGETGRGSDRSSPEMPIPLIDSDILISPVEQLADDNEDYIDNKDLSDSSNDTPANNSKTDGTDYQQSVSSPKVTISPSIDKSEYLLTDSQMEKLFGTLSPEELLEEYNHVLLSWAVAMELLKFPAGVFTGSIAGSMTFLFRKIAHLTKMMTEPTSNTVLEDLLLIRVNSALLCPDVSGSNNRRIDPYSLSTDSSFFRLVSLLACARRYLLGDVCSNTIENAGGGSTCVFWNKNGRRCCCSCAVRYAFEGTPATDEIITTGYGKRGVCEFQIATEFQWMTDSCKDKLRPSVPSYTPCFLNWDPSMTDWEQGVQLLDSLVTLFPYLDYFGNAISESEGGIKQMAVAERYTSPISEWSVNDMSACLTRQHRVFETEHPCEFLDLESEVRFDGASCIYIQFAVECFLPECDKITIKTSETSESVLLSVSPSTVSGLTIVVPGDTVYFKLIQEPMCHLGISCDHCSGEIRGLRFACTACSANYCERCAPIACHPVNHVFLRLRRPINHPTPTLPELYPADHIHSALFVRGHHHDTRCDRCFVAPITGIAWKCLNCPQYHLCSKCGKHEYLCHDRNHVFLMLTRPFPRLYGNYYSPSITFDSLYESNHWGVYFTVYTAARPEPEKVAIIKKNIKASVSTGWDPAQDQQLLSVVESNYPLLGTLDEPSLALLLSPEELGGKTPHTCRFRYCFIRMLNKKILKCLPYLNPADTHPGNILAAKLRDVRHVVSASIKAMLLSSSTKPQRASRESHKIEVLVKRLNQECSSFKQVFNQVSEINPLSLRESGGQPWTVTFEGEGSDDYGGPFRDSLTDIFTEACDDNGSNQILIPVPNAVAEVGGCREMVVPDPELVSPDSKRYFKFLGRLLGASVQSGTLASLSLPNYLWKRLTKQPVTDTDLSETDTLCYNAIEYLDSFEDGFTATTIKGKFIPLLGSRSHRVRPSQEPDLYKKLFLRLRRSELEWQSDAICEGFAEMLPSRFLSLYNCEDLAMVVCGIPQIDVQLLRENTFREFGVSDDVFAYLWEVLSDFTSFELSLFLKFVYGRSRLETTREFAVSMTVRPLETDNPNTMLPTSHTCFFTLDLPNYKSQIILRERLLYAISHCTVIDTDFAARE